MRILMITVASMLMLLWALPVLAEDDEAATDTATEATTEAEAITEAEEATPSVEAEPPADDKAAEETEADM